VASELTERPPCSIISKPGTGRGWSAAAGRGALLADEFRQPPYSISGPRRCGISGQLPGNGPDQAGPRILRQPRAMIVGSELPE